MIRRPFRVQRRAVITTPSLWACTAAASNGADGGFKRQRLAGVLQEHHCFAGGLERQGVVLLDNSVYTTNDVVLVQVGDSALAGAGWRQLRLGGGQGRADQATVTVDASTTFHRALTACASVKPSTALLA